MPNLPYLRPGWSVIQLTLLEKLNPLGFNPTARMINRKATDRHISHFRGICFRLGRLSKSNCNVRFLRREIFATKLSVKFYSNYPSCYRNRILEILINYILINAIVKSYSSSGNNAYHPFILLTQSSKLSPQSFFFSLTLDLWPCTCYPIPFSFYTFSLYPWTLNL